MGLCCADVTEHGCLTTVAATPSTAGRSQPEEDLRDELRGHLVTSASELDETAVNRARKLLSAQNGV